MSNVLTVVLLASLVAGSALAGGFSERRLDEVAAMLPEEPCADGARAADRAKWGLLAATGKGRARIAAAEKLLGRPVPDTPDELYLEFSKNGNRRNYEKCFFARLRGFENLYVAECLEHKGRFVNKIVEYVDAFCAMKSWTLPAHDGGLTCFKGTAHVDLFSSELTLSLAFCSDWLCDELPAATRAKIMAEIERRTLVPHLDHARGKRKLRHWWLHCGNNWNSVCNCNVVRTALATVKDRRLRAEFVLIAEESVPYALRGYNEDGYCSEGMGYWNYGYGHHLMMGLSVRNATGGKIDFFSDPKTKDVMKYAYGYQLVNGKSPFFADGGGAPSPVLLALGRQIWPDLVSTAALKCPTLAGQVLEFSLRAFGQEPAPVAPTMDVLPRRSWFPDAQVLISRSEDMETGRNFCIAIKGGHNAELHNHNDVGTYTILMDGQEMVGDPGGEVYTKRTFSRDRYKSKVLNSYGHPVPLIGGKLQRGGRAAAAKVIATNFTADEDSITLDCTAAYDVPSLRSLVRTMVFNRRRNTITITDKVSFKEPTAFEVPVITYREWVPEDGAMRFEFRNPKGKRTMSLDVTASASFFMSSENIENPGRPSPCRMKFAFEKPLADAEITMVFAASDQ